MSTIEVRIRHEDEISAVPFIKAWPISKLDDLIPLVRGWGVDAVGSLWSDACGQFVVNDTAAYFEVIVS